MSRPGNNSTVFDNEMARCLRVRVPERMNSPHSSKLCLLPLFVAASLNAGAQPARHFPHPDRIRYDGQCLTIDGKDTLIYSGAFHYFRCPKPLWHDRFQKIKEAGFNAVETYVPWNWHEPQMPSSLKDFSKVDLTDLRDWLNMAEELGFYIIIRPGPYICAEWDTGGFPQWLLTKQLASWKGEWLRSDEPTFLAWSKHWYDAVCPVLANHQITRKRPGEPGIILFQLENEYDYARFSDPVKVRHLKALGEAALANGIDVPLFTCWTHQIRGQTDPVLSQVFDACNFYPRWRVEGELRPAITKLRAEQPDAPLATTELQGGWFCEVGGRLSQDQEGVTAAQIQNLTLFALQIGDTLLNYYMLFGGSNLGDSAARNLTTTYDYNAPIREWGGVDARYQRVKAIGAMLREHGSRLAHAQLVDCEFEASQTDVKAAMRRAADGSRYIFVRTSEHAEPRVGSAHLKEKSGNATDLAFSYDLEPFGAKVLYLPPGTTDTTKSQWLPASEPAPKRPTDLPSPVVIASARRRVDSGPSKWAPLPSGQRLAQAGVYGSQFVFYTASAPVGAKTNLLVEVPAGDRVVLTANGMLAPELGGTAGTLAFGLPAGPNQLLMLYENPGHANFGSDIGNPSGIAAARLSSSPLVAGKPITGWRMHHVQNTNDRPEVKPDFNDQDWSPVAVDKLQAAELSPGQAAVYRAPLELTDAELKTGRINLNFARIDDLGWVYVNGEKIGATTDWSRSYSFDATKVLHPGQNLVAVVVQNTDARGGLGMPTVSQESDVSPVTLDAFGPPAGIEQRWWDPTLNDHTWETVNLGAQSCAPTNALLTWHRLRFNLPAPKPTVWVPWRLHLQAVGNGFLYLNGHPIGRYWEAGPQHDFFLPECWLNFGNGRANVLTVSLRSVQSPVLIASAAVEPYTDFAEFR